jgi:hypothetical protein
MKPQIVPATCFAYLENGNVCGKPAKIPDLARGCFVCEDHRPKKDGGRWIQPPLISASTNSLTSTQN